MESVDTKPATTEEPKKKRKGPCCVCKKTKTIRDECILMNSEEECIEFVRAHNQCLIKNGFKVDSDII